MQLFNQGKTALSWGMSGEAYSCEPWGAVEVPDALVEAVKSRGLPLAELPIAPESRARARVAEEEAAAMAEPLRALRKEADEAKADAEQARAETEKKHDELTKARVELRETREALAKAEAAAKRALQDQDAAEKLLSESAAEAEAAESRAIRAEALLNEKTEKPKTKRAG
jgi:hypothetical protein